MLTSFDYLDPIFWIRLPGSNYCIQFSGSNFLDPIFRIQFSGSNFLDQIFWIQLSGYDHLDSIDFRSYFRSDFQSNFSTDFQSSNFESNFKSSVTSPSLSYSMPVFSANLFRLFFSYGTNRHLYVNITVWEVHGVFEPCIWYHFNMATPCKMLFCLACSNLLN